jgi:hypothetical protein
MRNAAAINPVADTASKARRSNFIEDDATAAAQCLGWG